MKTFAESYLDLVAEIMSQDADYHVNVRTGIKISYLPWGRSFSMYLGDNILPTCGLRRTRPHISAAEAAWCFSGTRSLSWLSQHTKVWDAFSDYGNVNEAYGYRWRRAFGYDQIATALQRLIKDPTDRRIWITSYDPMRDLKPLDQKTVPCPVGFTLASHEERLDSTLVIRSSDVFLGLPLDVMRHAFVMRAIASSLGFNMGYMQVTMAHPHIYERQWEDASRMLEQDIKCPKIELPTHWQVDRIVDNPDQYMSHVKKTIAEATDWPDFDPKVKVVE